MATPARNTRAPPKARLTCPSVIPVDGRVGEEVDGVVEVAGPLVPVVGWGVDGVVFELSETLVDEPVVSGTTVVAVDDVDESGVESLVEVSVDGVVVDDVGGEDGEVWAGRLLDVATGVDGPVTGGVSHGCCVPSYVAEPSRALEWMTIDHNSLTVRSGFANR